MTSKPASRRARAMTLAPRSCPSSPGLATTTRYGRFTEADTKRWPGRKAHPGPGAPIGPDRPRPAGEGSSLELRGTVAPAQVAQPDPPEDALTTSAEAV